MLTNAPKTASSITPKQIALNTNSSGSVIYTVPAGKTFTGTFSAGGVNSYITINNISVYATGGASSLAAGVIPLTLLAGTVVTGSSVGGALVGVEQ